MKFSNNASKAPNINFMVIRDPEDYFRGSIITALNIGVDGLFFKAAGTEINHLHA